MFAENVSSIIYRSLFSSYIRFYRLSQRFWNLFPNSPHGIPKKELYKYYWFCPGPKGTHFKINCRISRKENRYIIFEYTAVQNLQCCWFYWRNTWSFHNFHILFLSGICWFSLFNDHFLVWGRLNSLHSLNINFSKTIKHLTCQKSVQHNCVEHGF